MSGVRRHGRHARAGDPRVRRAGAGERAQGGAKASSAFAPTGGRCARLHAQYDVYGQRFLASTSNNIARAPGRNTRALGADAPLPAAFSPTPTF